MVNVFEHKLGKRAPKIDKRTLKFRDYVKAPAAPLPYPPKEENSLSKVPSWPMYANDTLGDCAEAAAGHMIQLWNSFTSPAAAAPTTAQIVGAYSAITGYNPDDPNSDQGTVLLDLLKYWRKTGIAGVKILAYVALEPGNLIEMRQAVEIFGCAMLGVALPVTAQAQTAWTVKDCTGDGAPGSWGGHCIPVGAYNYIPPSTIRNTVVTWGGELYMSNNFYKEYNDEAWAVLTENWLFGPGADRGAPSGLNLAQLRADLAAL